MTTALNDPGEPHTDRSYWSRLTETPMRDLVRGRATGRLDTDALIQSAALPENLAAAIRRTVRRTRLWRLEKVDVARELIAHFRDGLETAPGAAAESLLRDFGDEKQAAKLIRRAKRRNRPLVWHAWRRGLQGFAALFLALVVGYSWLAYRYWTGEPKITHDYLADLNAKALAVPKDQAAWPLYREALLSLTMPREWWKKNDLYSRPGEWGWEATKRIVDENAAAIQRLRDAASKPALGLVLGHRWVAEDEPLFGNQEAPPRLAGSPPGGSILDSSFLNVLLPHISWLRRSQWMLAAGAFAAAEAGDGARAAANVRAILGIARQLREHDLLIADLSASSTVEHAASTAASLTADCSDKLSDQDLHAIAHALAAVRHETLRPRFEGERRWILDLVQRLYTDDGTGNGRVARTWDEAWGVVGDPIEGNSFFIDSATAPFGLAVLPTRREIMTEYDRLLSIALETAETPMWRRGPERIRPIVEARSALDRLRFSVVDMLFPSLERASLNLEFVRQKCDASLVAIALELFHRQHNAYPASLDELVPALLPSVPPDQYDGKPIKYALRDDGRPTLYSVGNDRADNGGRLHLTTDGRPDNGNPMRWMPPGGWPAGPDGRPAAEAPAVGSDWILYPPVRTPAKAPEEETEASPPSVPAQPAGD